MKLSTTFRTAALALVLGAAGAANAATLPVFTVSDNKLGIDSAAHVTYKVESAQAANTNAFLYRDGSWQQLLVGQSVTLYNVIAGNLKFAFTTLAPVTADFYDAKTHNGSDYIKLTYVTGQNYTIGFEDIKFKNGSDKDYNDLIVSASISAVPLPGAALLFGTSLLAGAAARRKKQKQQATGSAIAA